MSKIYYEYHFAFADKSKKSFTVEFDEESLKSEVQDEHHYPDWAQLEYCQCKNCSLTSEDYLYCPLAVNLVPIIYWCQDFASYDEVDVTVVSKERTVQSATTLQRGISSLLGLLMGSSACPKMTFLRPLARFHLPLASREETIFRTVSTAFLNNYFNADNSDAEAVLTQLKQDYEDLQQLNHDMAERIRSATSKDAAVNAIVLLDALSKSVSLSIDDSLQQIRHLFTQK